MKRRFIFLIFFMIGICFTAILLSSCRSESEIEQPITIHDINKDLINNFTPYQILIETKSTEIINGLDNALFTTNITLKENNTNFILQARSLKDYSVSTGLHSYDEILSEIFWGYYDESVFCITNYDDNIGLKSDVQVDKKDIGISYFLNNIDQLEWESSDISIIDDKTILTLPIKKIDPTFWNVPTPLFEYFREHLGKLSECDDATIQLIYVQNKLESIVVNSLKTEKQEDVLKQYDTEMSFFVSYYENLELTQPEIDKPTKIVRSISEEEQKMWSNVEWFCLRYQQMNNNQWPNNVPDILLNNFAIFLDYDQLRSFLMEECSFVNALENVFQFQYEDSLISVQSINTLDLLLDVQILNDAAYNYSFGDFIFLKPKTSFLKTLTENYQLSYSTDHIQCYSLYQPPNEQTPYSCLIKLYFDSNEVFYKVQLHFSLE